MKTTRAELIDILGEDQTLIFLEGPEFDWAIIGVIERFGQPPILCYDRRRVLQVLKKQGMSEQEAVEWYDFNIIGAWIGDETPCFIERFKLSSSSPLQRLSPRSKAPRLSKTTPSPSPSR